MQHCKKTTLFVVIGRNCLINQSLSVQLRHVLIYTKLYTYSKSFAKDIFFLFISFHLSRKLICSLHIKERQKKSQYIRTYLCREHQKKKHLYHYLIRIKSIKCFAVISNHSLHTSDEKKVNPWIKLNQKNDNELKISFKHLKKFNECIKLEVMIG